MITFTARTLFQLAAGILRPVTVSSSKKSVDVAFRCYPVDMDTYMHMNNACYLRVAELSRWRIFPATGLLSASIKEGMMFLAVDQHVKYLKPIKPFQRYVVETTCDVYKDDKWQWYKHTFVQHPDDVKPGQEPHTYAEINLRAVLKAGSGKTIPPSSLMGKAKFYDELFSMHPDTAKSVN